MTESKMVVNVSAADIQKEIPALRRVTVRELRRQHV
jgi:hypothetical protein